MASTYSPNLRLELIGTGEQQGTWGATTNTNLGTLLEEAIGGYTTVTVADAGDTTLTTANGAADQSRNMTINLTGTLTATRNVICPAIEKIYVVKNATSGGFAVTFKVTGQTGVSIPNGATMLIYVDGVDARQAGAIVGASNAVLANSIELGGTTDTTITRSSAGVIAVEGGVVPKENRENTFTNNQIISGNSLGWIARAGTTAGYATVEAQASDWATGYGATYLVRYGSSATGTTCGVSNAGLGILAFQNADNALIYANGGTPIVFGTSNAERMRIDASGNVGIGTTSPTVDGKGLQIKNTGGAASLRVSDNSGGTGFDILQASGAGYVWNRDNNVILFGTNNTERMRIDSSGNVGIGTSSPGQKLDVSGNIRSTGADANVLANATTGAAALAAISNARYWRWITSNGDSALRLNDETAGVERMRIDSSGNVLVGKTSASTTGAGVWMSGTGYIAVTRTGTASTSNVQFVNDNGVVGTISTSGSTTTYATSSDYRLKQNKTPVFDPVGRFMQLKPISFEWKADGTRVDGFFAHELADVVPEAVVGTKDAVDGDGNPIYQGIDQSKLVPLLTAALQEALTKIDALEARLAALEAA